MIKFGTRVRCTRVFFQGQRGTVIGEYCGECIVQLDRPIATQHGDQTGFLVAPVWLDVLPQEPEVQS